MQTIMRIIVGLLTVAIMLVAGISMFSANLNIGIWSILKWLLAVIAFFAAFLLFAWAANPNFFNNTSNQDEL